MPYWNTSELLRELGIADWQLRYLLRQRLVPRPQLDASGHLIWNEPDIERVRKALSVQKQRNEKRKKTGTVAIASGR